MKDNGEGTMKKKLLYAALFILIFTACYLIMSFAIPGFRIKLYAEPWVYFVESIRHNVSFKAAVSAAAALVIDVLAAVVAREVGKFQLPPR